MKTLILLVFWASLATVTALGGVSPMEGSAAIVGKVTLGKTCSGDVQVWVSTNKTLLYQATVPANGNFEFRTLAGTFSVAATGRDGCFAEKIVQAKAGDINKINLNMARNNSKPGGTREN